MQRSGLLTNGILGRRARAVCVATLVGAAAFVPLSGCATDGRSDAQTEAPETLSPAERLALAWRLADDAERERERGRLLEAADLYRRSVSYSGTIAAVWNNYGKTLYELGDLYNAVEAFKRAAESEPTDPRPFEHIGHIYYEIGWDEPALDYYEKSLSITPTHLRSLRGAVLTADRIGRVADVDLERIRLALLVERDDAYRSYFNRRQSQVKERLKEERAFKNRSG